MSFPSLAKPLSGYYCRIWAWHIEPERDGERQHCCCKSLQREDEGSMSNPEWCRVIYDGLLASGSTAMFYRQAMMRGRQLHPCVAGEGPTGSVAGGTGHVAETRGRLDIADRQCPGVTVEIVKRLLVDIDSGSCSSAVASQQL
jgi:hypothetical protein